VTTSADTVAPGMLLKDNIWHVIEDRVVVDFNTEVIANLLLLAARSMVDPKQQIPKG